MTDEVSSHVTTPNILVLSPNAQQEYENLRNYLLLRFQKPYTAPKIITLIASGVTFLAKVKTVDGPEKKQLVLQAIRDVITQVNLDDETKNELLLVVDTFGDNAIEELVKLGKDMYTFAQEKCKKCCIL